MTERPDIRERLQKIRMLAMDVDGVLTDGGVYILDDGREFRRFDIKDGLGIKQVLEAGILVVWLSAGQSLSAVHRGRRLGVEEVHLGIKDKLLALEKICEEKKIGLSEVAYIGDDRTDLGVMQKVGVPCAPADAQEEVKRLAVYVTGAPGGNGAVREVSEILLR